MSGKVSTTKSVENPWNDLRDRLCVHFEDAWGNGEKPKIEDFLRGVAGAERLNLLYNLLLVEVECRRRNNEQPAADDYRERFADAQEIIGAVFQSVCGASPDWIDRFKVVRTLGDGGFGQVYLCFDETLERSVAIKVPRADRLSSKSAKAYFLAEARNVAGLQHKSIVTLHEFGESEGLCYLVYEYIAGYSLDQRLRQSPIDQLWAARIVCAIAEALHYAHAEDVYVSD